MIFRLGADQELPSGFWELVVLIVITDILQTLFLRYYYLKRPTFWSAAIFFSLGMILLGLLVVKFKFELIWLLVCAAVGLGYSIFFYCLNRMLLHLMN